MRRFLLFSLTLCLLLTGCAAPNAASSSASSEGAPLLDEESVLSAYDSAAEAYDWFNMGTMPLDANDVKTADGLPYQRVDEPGIASLAELRDYLSGIFAPEVAESLLNDGSSIPHYRDIDGVLYAADAARGANINFRGKTVSAKEATSSHWTVTLTFYADSCDIDPAAAVIGWSQTILDYERQEDGQWRFTNFCPSDNLDEDADTVFTFNYQDDAAFSRADYLNWNDLKLACWLLHADGAYSEGPGDTLTERFLADPDAWFDALSVFPSSPWEYARTVMSKPAYSAASGWFTAEQSGQFQNILDTYQPKNDAERTLLDNLKSIYQTQSVSVGNQFALHAASSPMLVLGKQEGSFPWGMDLSETPQSAGTGDNGEALYSFSHGGIHVSYFVSPDDGSSFIYRLTTDRPGVETSGGAAVGDSLETVLAVYPSAVEYEALQPALPADFDTVYVYEPGGLAFCRHIAFFLKDGSVSAIETEDLMDGRLLPEA